MLSIGGMSLDSTDVLLKSVDLTLGPPRLRSVMDSVVYGRGGRVWDWRSLHRRRQSADGR